ncbi:hypothetical protein Q7P37_003698 [Cladosporium fusiforme]
MADTARKTGAMAVVVAAVERCEVVRSEVMREQNRRVGRLEGEERKERIRPEDVPSEWVPKPEPDFCAPVTEINVFEPVLPYPAVLEHSPRLEQRTHSLARGEGVTLNYLPAAAGFRPYRAPLERDENGSIMPDNHDSSDDEGELGIFAEPADYYQPEKEPTFAQHEMQDGRELRLRMVGHNPLWGHLLWNAGRTLATYLETNASSLIRGKTILELGAGAGLPSLVSAIHGARHVVVTDYPDAELVENLQWNIDHCALLPQPRNVRADGFLWGAETEKLITGLPEGEDRFDLLILADLLFNHSEHHKLVATVKTMLKRSADAQALVFFTPYRPWLLPNDLAFFDLVKEAGFEVDKFFEHTMEKVMFEEDPGDELLRRTVFGYKVTWAKDQLP